MFILVLMILMAWFVQMPLWLSIIITIYCGLLFFVTVLEKILKWRLKRLEKELRKWENFKLDVEKIRREWDEKI